MAIKNSMTKTYSQNAEQIMQALRNPRFSRLLDAEFIEEAISSAGVEFRYVRKTTLFRYGKNYFIKVVKEEDGTSSVTVAIQSRKVTVLFDPNWENDADNIYNCLDVLLELLASVSE